MCIRSSAILLLALAVAVVSGANIAVRRDEGGRKGSHSHETGAFKPSVAYEWISVYLNVTGLEVTLNGARPTVISRGAFILTSSMYDAWAYYSNRAAPSVLDAPSKKRPASNSDRETAVSYAAYRALLHLYPGESKEIRAALAARKLDPDFNRRDNTPRGIGNKAADAVIKSRENDKSNSRGDIAGSNGSPFSDYTGYVPVNTLDKVNDPDRWQPITFFRPDGTNFTPSYLTPFWGEVKPFGLKNGSMFRSIRVPKVGEAQLTREVEQVIAENADMTLASKASVEFFRDGPQSSSQSGQWLSFSQTVSLRDRHDLEKDVKMFFGLGVVGLDAFIASWDTKRFYESSRPWTLVHYLFTNKTIRGWGGPGKGTVVEQGKNWFPYSPRNFITPPFPGYVSGHSAFSGASSKFLEKFTGNDNFGYKTSWLVGSLTEPGIPCYQIQSAEGKAPPPRDLNCTVEISLASFTETAEKAGFSRIQGGFHIQSDNIEGLKMGRSVTEYDWDIIQSYFNGKPKRKQDK